MKKLFFASFFFLSCLPTVKNLANSSSENLKNNPLLNSSESLTIGQYLGSEANDNIINQVDNFKNFNMNSEGIHNIVTEMLNILRNTFDQWDIKFHLPKIKIADESTWIPIYGSYMSEKKLKIFLLYNGSTDDFFVGPLTESADKSEFYKSQPLKFIGSKNLAVFIYENIEVKPDKLYLYKGDEQILKIAVSTNNLSGIKDKYKILDL